MVQIIIAGDLVPTESNIELFNSGDMSALLGTELLKLWNSADVRIFNLESPLCQVQNPISKCGPNLYAPLSTAYGISKLRPDLIALSNNHVLDQGEQGIKSTVDVLNEYKIPFIGAGENLKEASKPYIIKKDNIKIGIYNCAENEFSIATHKSSGANPFDPLQSLDHIYDLKKQCDYVIVIYHGGKEHYTYPSPNLQKVCRKMVEKGADAVICQHSHCIGCYEEYNDSLIVYGQGNFIFDYLNNDFWKTGLLIKINLGINIKNSDKKVEFIPIVKNKNSVKIANDSEKNSILEMFLKRSEEITEEGFIEKRYEEFAKSNINFYLGKFSAINKLFLYLDRKIFKGILIKSIYGSETLLSIRNFIECEAHRELILEGIKIRENNKNER